MGEVSDQGVDGEVAEMAGCGDGGGRERERELSDLEGTGRTESLRRSADFVSSFRRLGAEGRRGGGGGRRKPAWDGGGEGEPSTILIPVSADVEDIIEDMSGRGERGGGKGERGGGRGERGGGKLMLRDDMSNEERLSISGRDLERNAALVSSWKSPLFRSWLSESDKMRV
jgi:hypothetical protein